MSFEVYRKRGKSWEYLGAYDATDSRKAALRASYVHNIKVVGVRPEYSRDKISSPTTSSSTQPNTPRAS